MSRLVLLLALLILPRAVVLAEDAGAIRHTFPTPAGAAGYKSHWAFDDTLGRHYFYADGVISVVDRDGVAIKSWSVSESENFQDFSSAFAGLNEGAFFFLGESTIYLLGSNKTTVTVWSFSDVGSGKGEVAQTDSIDFTDVLGVGCISAIDRAPDGTWWVICGGTVYHINPSGDGVRQSFTFGELSEKLFGVSGLSVWSEFIAIDRLNGDLFLHGRLSTAENRDHFYRIDPASLLQRGRFLAPVALTNSSISRAHGRLVGGANGFAMRTELAAAGVIEERALEVQEIPTVTAVSFDQEGILWTYCPASASALIEAKFTVDWGDGQAGSLLDLSPILFGNFPTLPAGSMQSIKFQRSRLDDFPANFQEDVFFRNDLDQISTPIAVDIPLGSFSGPVMFGALCNFALNETNEEKKITWSWNSVAPKEPFNAWVEFADFVPWVGGKRYGIQEVQATGKAEIASKDEGSISVSGGGDFIMGPGKLRLEFGGGVLQSLTPEGPEVSGGLVSVKVAGTVQEEAGILEAFPQLAPLKQMRFVGSAFNWLNDRAKLTASITLGLDASTKVKLSAENDLLFEGELVGSLALGIAAAVKLIGGYAEVTAYGEGKGTAKFVPNDLGLTLTDVSLSALVSLKLRIYLLERFVQRVITMSSAEGATPRDALGEVIFDSGPRYAYSNGGDSRVRDDGVRPHVLEGNPFQVFKRQERSGFRVTGPESFDHEIKVLGGIPAGATVHSAIGDGGTMAMVVWTQPVPGNPVTQATDIWYSFFDGTSYSDPAPLSTDDRADFNPKVHFWRPLEPNAVNGEAFVVIWERNGLAAMQPTGDPQADSETIIENLRPCWSYFDPIRREWSAPVEFPLLGQNGFNLQFMENEFGRVEVCWLESDHGGMLPWDLNSSAVSTAKLGGVRLRHARFLRNADENGWAEMVHQPVNTLGDQDALAGIADDIMDYAAASREDFLQIWAVRMEEVSAVSPFVGKTRLDTWYQQRFVAGSALKRQVSGITPFVISSPRASVPFHNAWLYDGHIAPQRFSTQVPYSIAIVGAGGTHSYEPSGFSPDDPRFPTGAAFHNFKITSLPHPTTPNFGRVGSVYNMPDEFGRLNVHLAVGGRNPGPIVRDGDTERHLSVASSIGSSVLAMYQKVPLRTTPQRVVVRGEEAELVLVEEEPAGYFAMTRHIVASDFMAGRVSIRSGLALPGKTVRLGVEVHNTGDYQQTNPALRLSLYAVSHDDSRGEVITIAENEIVSNDMPGNSTVVKEFDWVVPEEGTYYFIASVDPDNLITEFDEGNNIAESEVPLGLPREIIEWLVGRLSAFDDFDANGDGIVDSADVE